MTKPWLPYLATEYIRGFRPKSVFEWGSGESTVFFAELPSIHRLVSIEHDPMWYSTVTVILGARKPHLSVIDRFIRTFEQGEIGSDKANPHHYKSGSTELGQVNFKRYASAIDNYTKFDLILIDGMARASCLYHAFNHVNPGGCIVLDNTGDRPYYLEQTEYLFGDYQSGWERIDFMGYGPILDYKWQTTFFINRTKADYES